MQKKNKHKNWLDFQPISIFQQRISYSSCTSNSLKAINHVMKKVQKTLVICNFDVNSFRIRKLQKTANNEGKNKVLASGTQWRFWYWFQILRERNPRKIYSIVTSFNNQCLKIRKKACIKSTFKRVWKAHITREILISNIAIKR